MIETYQKVELLMRAGYVKRWHREAYVPSQSIAEHSWRVAIIAREVFGWGLNELGDILYHDVDEIFTGDIPATTKWEAPEIKELLDRMAQNWRQAHDIDSMRLDGQAAIEFKVCDWSEAALYCLEQLEIGNRNSNLSRTFYRLIYACEERALDLQHVTDRDRAYQWISTLVIRWEELGGANHTKEELTNE